jgi:hypothetical protein
MDSPEDNNNATHGDRNNSEPEKFSFYGLLNPIVLLSLIIVLSVVALIGAAVLGVDRGVLANMSRSEFARGLITYLYAVVTIGTAVVLVLSALLGSADPAHERRFERGKEILALMLGVFGTIVGFYFGQAQASSSSPALQISTLDVSPRSVQVGADFTIRAVVTGGMLPYRFGIAIGNEATEPTDTVADGGWLTKQMTARQLRPDEPAIVTIVVQDGGGRRTSQTAQIDVKSPPK